MQSNVSEYFTIILDSPHIGYNFVQHDLLRVNVIFFLKWVNFPECYIRFREKTFCYFLCIHIYCGCVWYWNTQRVKTPQATEAFQSLQSGYDPRIYLGPWNIDSEKMRITTLRKIALLRLEFHMVKL